MQKTDNKVFNYPLSYNPIIEYWYQIKDKKVVVSKKYLRYIKNYTG